MTPSRKDFFLLFTQSNKFKIINHVLACKLDLSDFPMNALPRLPKKKKKPVGTVAICSTKISFIHFI